MELIDFTDLPERKKSYCGVNGIKFSVILNDELYMLKLPAHVANNPNLPYDNSCISEYLGCHIFSLLGIDSQETIIGKFNYKGTERIAVACKDFER